MAIECVEQQEWIEEEISKPIEEWVEKREKKCKKYAWYDPRGWFCWIETYFVKITSWVIVKVGKWVVRTICKVVGTLIGTIWDILNGLWDVIAGIFTLDWRRILDGLIKILASTIIYGFTIIRVITLGDTVDYIIEEYHRSKLRDYVRKKLEDKYTGEELQNIKDALHLDHGAFGYRIPMRSVRTYVDSETLSPSTDPDEAGMPNLVVLNKHGDIDLKELCGFKFTEGFWNRKRYKTLKKGPIASGGGGGEVNNPISEDEVDTYISSFGAEGPKFTILSMPDGVLKIKLRTAELKARELGLVPYWITEDKEVTLANDIKHDNDSVLSLVTFLIDVIGRKTGPNAVEDLCTPVAVGVFRYTKDRRGLTACLKGTPSDSKICTSGTSLGPQAASGLTFIDNMPDFFRKYIPIHELGHYFGLCHVDGVENIMYPGHEKSWHNGGWTWLKYLYTKGEPSFTFDEAKQTWDYIVENFPSHCLIGDSQGPIIT